MDGSITALRWLARLLGLIPAVIAWTIMIGESVAEPAGGWEAVAVVLLLAALTASAVTAQFLERIGGAAEIAAALAFAVLVFVTAGHNRLLAAVLLPLPWFLSGVLFLCIDWVARRRSPER